MCGMEQQSVWVRRPRSRAISCRKANHNGVALRLQTSDTIHKEDDKSMNVLLLGLRPYNIDEDDLARVREIAAGYDVVVTRARDDVEALLPAIEIVAGDFPRDLLAGAPKLRWWQQWHAGVDWLMDYPDASDMDFILTNVSGLHAIPITEHIFAMLLAFARDLPNVIRAQERKAWISHERDDVFELAGKTMALIGVGGIGSHTAEVATALGMRVIAVRRHADRPVPGIERTVGVDRLREVLPEVDFVVNTLPLTPDTQGLIGEPELRAMRPTAYVVNIGRGGTMDEDALIRALQDRWIAGAGLDVFETEPLPSDSPFWELDNVIVSPHYAGQTNRYDERAMAIFLDNLYRYLRGETLRNVVDKQLGY
jgi:phosphoglycerate dehydrogenase-like enzyme